MIYDIARFVAWFALRSEGDRRRFDGANGFEDGTTFVSIEEETTRYTYAEMERLVDDRPIRTVEVD